MTERADGMTVLIAAGGTGGHVYPALAVADWLRARGARVLWLGTSAGIEARLVPAAGFELHELKASGLRGNGDGALVESAVHGAWRRVARTDDDAP